MHGKVVAPFVALFVVWLLGVASADATTYYFVPGDAFFVAQLNAEAWSTSADTLKLDYARERIMKCGVEGERSIRVTGLDDGLRDFVKRAASEGEGPLWIMFYPRGYNPTHYGFGVRYNDVNPGGDLHDVSDELNWLSLKRAKRVPALPVKNGVMDLREVDVYVFGGAKLHQFVYARDQMVGRLWRQGKEHTLQFSRGAWREARKPVDAPWALNRVHAESNPVFPTFKITEAQRRRVEALKARNEGAQVAPVKM